MLGDSIEHFRHPCKFNDSSSLSFIPPGLRPSDVEMTLDSYLAPHHARCGSDRSQHAVKPVSKSFGEAACLTVAAHPRFEELLSKSAALCGTKSCCCQATGGRLRWQERYRVTV